MTAPAVAVLGDVGAGVLGRLSDAGLQVTGALAGDPLADAPEVRLGARYAGLPALLRDRSLHGVVLTADSPVAGALLELVQAGLGVVLADAAPWDADLLRSARHAAAEADVPVVGLLAERHRGWSRLVEQGLSGRPAPQQVTVRGWPRGVAAAAELVDLVRGWCGDVVACAAVPATLPAEVLPGGERVAWALLTARGSTVLVSHDGDGPQVRLSLPTARLLARPATVSWEGGGAVVPTEQADPTLPAFAAALRARSAEPLEGTRVADLADLAPLGRVLAALRESARTEVWVALS